MGTRLDGLLRAACQVIAERGMANTRTADVARAAGVSPALLFYHFTTREQLLVRAFGYAAERELGRIEAVLRSPAPPLTKLRQLLRLHADGHTTPMPVLIDGWAVSLHDAELERASRRLDLRRRAALAETIAAAADSGAVSCDDPRGAAYRIMALIDGLAVQASAHSRVTSRGEAKQWISLVVARELGLDPEGLC